MWSPGLTLDQMEVVVIQEALRFYRGNKTQTAASLGICTNTLNSKLERHEQQAKEQSARNEQLKRRPGPGSNARMEPVSIHASQQSMSVSERKEV